MHIASIGIDLGKTTFHLVALGERSKVLVRKKFSRAQLLAYTANLPASLIGRSARLDPGAPADLVLLDRRSAEVVRVMRRGRWLG